MLYGEVVTQYKNLNLNFLLLTNINRFTLKYHLYTQPFWVDTRILLQVSIVGSSKYFNKMFRQGEYPIYCCLNLSSNMTP